MTTTDAAARHHPTTEKARGTTVVDEVPATIGSAGQDHVTDSAARVWVVTVGEMDDAAEQPAIFRTYEVTEDQARQVTEWLGTADETTILGERSMKAANEAYDAGIHL